MTKRDFFRLAIGKYELVDSINNYYYTMRVGLNNDNSRYYRIREKGSLRSDSIFMTETYVDEYGEYDSNKEHVRFKTLNAIANVGGLSVLSNDNFRLLNELNFIPRGSFKKFVENTNGFVKNH